MTRSMIFYANLRSSELDLKQYAKGPILLTEIKFDWGMDKQPQPLFLLRCNYHSMHQI